MSTQRLILRICDVGEDIYVASDHLNNCRYGNCRGALSAYRPTFLDGELSIPGSLYQKPIRIVVYLMAKI